MRVALLGCLCLAACVAPAQRFRVADLRFVVADPEQVNEHCRHHGGTDDKGRPLGPDTVTRCCYEPSKRTVVVGRGNEDCILHELCHASGKAPAFCDEYIHLDRPVRMEPVERIDGSRWP